MAHPLIGKIEQREAVIGVIGLGYVGLPLVLAFRQGGVSGAGVRHRLPASRRRY